MHFAHSSSNQSFHDQLGWGVWTLVSTSDLLFFISIGIPTMMELLYFKGKEKTFNVAVHVGAKFTDLGIFLLNDQTGVIVESLRKEFLLNAVDINMAIFRQWLQGKGAQPVAWSTLIDVLRKIGLCTLASDIEEGLIVGSVIGANSL